MHSTVFKSSLRRYNLVLASLIIRRKRNKRVGREYIRELFRNRANTGEFFLLSDLENDPTYHHKYFRMKKDSFEEILGLTRRSLAHSTNHAYPIPPKLRLALTLRFLALGTPQAALAVQYRISPSSVCLILRETMKAILDSMESTFLPSPIHKTWIDAEKTFAEKWNFPFCIGAIDGKHVRVRAPWRSGSLNFNYKGYFSVVVMAVASGDYRFLAVDIGAPGSESDAAIFSKAAFSRLVESKNLQIPENGKIGETEVPFVFVGDEAFPLKPWLMRPFPGSDLDMNKRIFNYRLSRARRVVENTFGIWSSRWRILFTAIDGDQDLIQMIIRSTIVLHNFLREKGDANSVHANQNESISQNELNGNVLDIPRVGANNYTMSAFGIREKFIEYFVSPDGSLPGQSEYVMRS